MNMIQSIRTLAYAIILTSISFTIGQTANAQQYEVKNQKEIYWSIGKSDLVIKAGKRLEAGKLEQARKLYKQSLKTTLRMNDRLIAYINLSVIDNTQKAYENALKYSNKALKIAPDNWLALNNRGTAYFGLGKFEQAKQDYVKAISLQPGDEGLAYNQQLVQSKITPVYAQQ
ncbi:MAG: tetratricopeptide repeat protein [Alphaproteobacteria bacterium]|nr:tetratricopeptide repeat protein [Alphaproteobacteria bacterium]